MSNILPDIPLWNHKSSSSFSLDATPPFRSSCQRECLLKSFSGTAWLFPRNNWVSGSKCQVQASTKQVLNSSDRFRFIYSKKRGHRLLFVWTKGGAHERWKDKASNIAPCLSGVQKYGRVKRKTPVTCIMSHVECTLRSFEANSIAGRLETVWETILTSNWSSFWWSSR